MGAAPRLRQAPDAPVEQLIIQYQDNGPAEARQAGAAALSAGRRVARSAVQAQVPGLRYLRSVSPRLHVARLDQALPADQAQALLQRLRADPAVVSVAVDRRVRWATVPTDPYFAGSEMTAPRQWHLQSSSSVPGGINAGAAWAGSTGTGVVVAVLDGGYRPHADLVGNLARDSSGNVIGHDFILDLWTANDGDARDADALDPGTGCHSPTRTCARTAIRKAPGTARTSPGCSAQRPMEATVWAWLLAHGCCPCACSDAAVATNRTC